MSRDLLAMQFARLHHFGQVRKYTGNPYTDHLAEVAGIVATVAPVGGASVAVAWLHDTLEDCPDVKFEMLVRWFGSGIAEAVRFLTDVNDGSNRAARKAATCRRLAQAPGWVQTVKVADIISNTSSIVAHDPKFAGVYLREKADLLDVLTHANRDLVRIAREQC